VNPLFITVGVPLALFGALMLIARPAEAPGEGHARDYLLKLPGSKWHISSPETTRRLKGAYPETVDELSRKWSRVFDTPVSWLRSQAYAESRNVLTAVNAVTGATGVLQILPATGRWLVESLRKSAYGGNFEVLTTLKNAWRGHPGDLLNPDLNIMLAAYYLLLLRKKFGDDHDIVSAAYNMGPSKIAYYIRNGKSLPTASRTYITMVHDAKLRGFT